MARSNDMIHTEKKAELALFFVAMCWGGSTVLNKIAIAELEPFNLISLRFAVAFLLAAAVFRKNLRNLRPATVKSAVLLGVVLFLVYVFANYGVGLTSASNVGVLTCLSGLLIPILQFLLFRKKLGLGMILCVASALCGIVLLMGGFTLSFNIGDFLCILCSLAAAGHILLTDKIVRQESAQAQDAIGLGVLQLGVVAFLGTLFSFLFETPQLPETTPVWCAVLVLGLFCSAAAYMVQTMGQKTVSPLRTGLIFSTEPVFGTLFAFVFWGEILNPLAYLGIALIIGAIVSMEFQK